MTLSNDALARYLRRLLSSCRGHLTDALTLQKPLGRDLDHLFKRRSAS